MIGSVSFEVNVKHQRVQSFAVKKLDLKAVISAGTDTDYDCLESHLAAADIQHFKNYSI